MAAGTGRLVLTQLSIEEGRALKPITDAFLDPDDFWGVRAFRWSALIYAFQRPDDGILTPGERQTLDHLLRKTEAAFHRYVQGS